MAFLLVLKTQATNKKKAIPIIPLNIDMIENSNLFIFFDIYECHHSWIILNVLHL